MKNKVFIEFRGKKLIQKNLLLMVQLSFLLSIAPFSDEARCEFLRRIEKSETIEVQAKFARYHISAPFSVDLLLVGMIHVGQQSFYDRAEEVLTGTDVELFEGVAPIGFYGPPFINDPDFISDDARVRLSKLRLYTLRKILKANETKYDSPPHTLEQLLASRPPNERSFLPMGDAVDGWGNPFQLIREFESGSIDIKSLGSDGQLGGIGFAKDIGLTEALRPKVDSDELLSALGSAYQSLAKQGQLALQPRRLNYLGLKAVRADISSDLIFGDPTNLIGTQKYWIWRENLPTILLSTQFLLPNSSLPESTRKFAIVYGAGHGDQQEQLLLGLGFKKTSEEWVTAISVSPDLDKSVSAARLNLIEKLMAGNE